MPDQNNSKEILLYFYPVQNNSPNKFGHPVAIACIIPSDNGTFSAGCSVCSKSEHNFNKKLGLKIARGRAESALKKGICARFPKVKKPYTMKEEQIFIERFIIDGKWNKELTFQSVLIPY